MHLEVHTMGEMRTDSQIDHAAARKIIQTICKWEKDKMDALDPSFFSSQRMAEQAVEKEKTEYDDLYLTTLWAQFYALTSKYQETSTDPFARSMNYMYKKIKDVYAMDMISYFEMKVFLFSLYNFYPERDDDE